MTWSPSSLQILRKVCSLCSLIRFYPYQTNRSHSMPIGKSIKGITQNNECRRWCVVTLLFNSHSDINFVKFLGFLPLNKKLKPIPYSTHQFNQIRNQNRCGLEIHILHSLFKIEILNSHQSSGKGYYSRLVWQGRNINN